MTKNEYFGPILDVFGPKILIFRAASKSFGTNITENHLDDLSILFFGQASDQIWPFWAQNPIFGGQGVKILVPSYRTSNETPFFVLKTLIGEAPIGR